MFSENAKEIRGKYSGKSRFEKCEYSKPVLNEYGTVTTLTMGGGGSLCDANNPVSSNNSVNDCEEG